LRIIERGKGKYHAYPDFEEVLVDEFLISGYKKNEILTVYHLEKFCFSDVYGECSFGEIENIKIEKRHEITKFL